MHPGTYSLERIGQRRRVLASPLGHVGAAAALAPDAGRDVSEEFARADPAACSAAHAGDQGRPPPLGTRQDDHRVAQLLPQPVDRFLIVDVWHHIEDQAGYLALMKKQLKPGGQVVMIDFHKKELPVGPPVDMKISREDLLKQMEGAGFRLAKEHTFLPYQYFLVFEPAG